MFGEGGAKRDGGTAEGGTMPPGAGISTAFGAPVFAM